LQQIVDDLDQLKPERLQGIVKFAMKCAEYPDLLTEEDYEMVREQGVTDEEIVEIISLAAIGTYFDTLAEALKLEPDSIYTAKLPGGPLVR
jgi:alkylhydroperoxidase family enzyme